MGKVLKSLVLRKPEKNGAVPAISTPSSWERVPAATDSAEFKRGDAEDPLDVKGPDRASVHAGSLEYWR